MWPHLDSVRTPFVLRLALLARFHVSEDGYAARADKAKLGALVAGAHPNGSKDVVVFRKGSLIPASHVGERLDQGARLRIDYVQRVRGVVGGVDEVVPGIEPQFVSRDVRYGGDD